MNWVIWFIILTVATANIAFDVHYENAVAAVEESDYIRAMTHLTKAHSINSRHVGVNKMLGALYFMEENYETSKFHFFQAVQHSNWKDPNIIANYIESLRLGDDITVLQECEKVLSMYRDDYTVLYACAKATMDNNLHETAADLFVQALHINSNDIDVWQRLGDALLACGRYDDVEMLMRQGIAIHPSSAELFLPLALSYHYRNMLQQALDVYLHALTLNPTSHSLLANTGAVYQSLGRTDEALQYYNAVFPNLQDDAGFLNNYGALLMLVSRDEEAVVYLKRAIDLEPKMENPLTNLASYYQDEGLLDTAREYFRRAQELSLHSRHIAIRVALFLSPVVSSWEQMLSERRSIIDNLTALISQRTPEAKYFQTLDATLDRIHFYICYSGLNDRYVQDLVAEAYRLNIKNVSAISDRVEPMLDTSKRRARIGFLSKFFGVFEPHGLLLDGVLRYLPRTSFEVFALPVARTDGKALSPSISEYADHTMEVSLSHVHAIEAISNLQLDILVFADTLSEPMTHFLAFNRLAGIQMAFWGNPITSGSPHIDYFISSDMMEHPYRTRIPDDDVPYTEQVVLIEGQGIWYYAPLSEEVRKVERMFNLSSEPVRFARSEFNFADNWFICFCPQSVFKMHPSFDAVLYDILDSNERIHIVLTAGRKKSWTEVYINRLTKALGKHVNRCHMIERVSSQHFLGLLRIADVLLHPFPFDGSRTSADSLAMGIPMITMPTEYLRGRMGAAFLRTMNIPELVARNRSEYVEIAYRLSVNTSLYEEVSGKIRDRSHLIWEDMDVPFSWMQFLSRVAGKDSLSWEQYVISTGRNLTHETQLRSVRESNRIAFGQSWGDESWLLSDGIAHLDAIVPSGHMIRPFNDWKSEINKGSSNDELAHVLQQMAEHALQGDVESAYEVGAAAYQIIGDSAPLLLELGALEYFRGNHKEALEICERASSVHYKRNQIIEACIGVSALYLGLEHKAVPALRYAWEQRQKMSEIRSNIFLLTQEATEVNYLMALSTFHRYDECVRASEEILHLPDLTWGGAYPLLFSFVEWKSNKHAQYISELEQELKRQDVRYSLDLKSMLQEVQRLQQGFPNLIGIASDCLSERMLSDAETKHLQFVIDRLLDIISIETSTQHLTKHTLITQFYQFDESLPVLDDGSDMLMTLIHNLANPYIAEIHLLTEREYDFTPLQNAKKIKQFVIGKRLSFQNAFQHANNYLSKKSVILANADVYFDESLKRLSSHTVESRSVSALLKWKDTFQASSSSLNFTDAVTMRFRIDSQDAWVFTPPIVDEVLLQADFEMGLPRCDNRLAAIFRSAGYNVHNPALFVRAIEYHTRSRNSGIYSMKGSVSGEGANVFLSAEP